MSTTRLQPYNRTGGNNVAASVQGLATGLVAQAQTFLDRLLPPEQRSALWARLQTFAAAHPIIAAFLLCQVALSGIPLLVFITFTTSVFVFSLVVGLIVGLVGALLFTAFMVLIALFFVLPTLFFTTMAATFTFLWAFAGFYFLKWINSGAPAAQGRAVTVKLNDLTGGRLNSLMVTARETAQNTPPAKRANGLETETTRSRQVKQVKQEEKDSADEKSSNGFTVLSEPAESPFDDVNVNSTTDALPRGRATNNSEEPLGTARAIVPGVSEL